ncbi:RAB3A interacting protein [Coemansia sp. RSA 1822]|nr:RAB3A interacting protein [Coemansia sp. RSA 638]KAJ2541438.1 RAB3A interacting protein [Coemansia sp. RSA 1853]KAJ2561617.1 RAB3A interacting protein [Coemansia sp. RSA 1822]
MIGSELVKRDVSFILLTPLTGGETDTVSTSRLGLLGTQVKAVSIKAHAKFLILSHVQLVEEAANMPIGQFRLEGSQVQQSPLHTSVFSNVGQHSTFSKDNDGAERTSQIHNQLSQRVHQVFGGNPHYKQMTRTQAANTVDDKSQANDTNGLRPLDTSAAALKGASAETDHLATPTDSNPERSYSSLDGGVTERLSPEPDHATLDTSAYITKASAASYCAVAPGGSTLVSGNELRSVGPPSPTDSGSRTLLSPMGPASRSLAILEADIADKPRVLQSMALATPPLTASVPPPACSQTSPHKAAKSLVSLSRAEAQDATRTEHAAVYNADAYGQTGPLCMANKSAEHVDENDTQSRPMSTILLVAATAENSSAQNSTAENSGAQNITAQNSTAHKQRESNWFRRQSKSSSFSGQHTAPLSPANTDMSARYEAPMLRAQEQRNAAMAEASQLQQRLEDFERSTTAELTRLRTELETTKRKLRTEYELRTAAEAKCSVMECELAELSSNIQLEAQNLVALERREHKTELEQMAKRHKEVVQLMDMERAQVGSLKQSLEQTSNALDHERDECERLRTNIVAFERQFSTLVAPMRDSTLSTAHRSISPVPVLRPGSRLTRSAPQSLENTVSASSSLCEPHADAHISGRMYFGNDAARSDTRLAEFLGFINVASEKEAQSSAFMQRSLREDVGPTLSADASSGLPSLTGWSKHRRLLHCVQDTTLVLESYVPRMAVDRVLSVACYLCAGSASRSSMSEPRLSGRSQCEMYRMRFGDSDTDNKPLCMHCHGRMVAVCSFFSYLKIVRRGLIKRPIADIWLEVNRVRLQMWLARSGASPDCSLQITA